MRLASLVVGLSFLGALTALAAKPAKKPPSPAPPPSPNAPKCDGCEYTCMFATLIVDHERYGWLFENLAPVVKSALALDSQVKDLSREWGKRDEKDRGGPPLHCMRWLLSPERAKKGEAKPDKELQRVLDHTNPVEGEAMTTNWSTKDCKIDTKGLESKVCAALYKSLLAHEMSHHDSCVKAWEDPDVADATLTQRDKGLRAADEVRAYKAGIAALEKEMMDLAKKKGCGLETCSRDNLAPPPTPEEIEQAKKDIEAIPSFLRSGK
jgi:hypothetical protein